MRGQWATITRRRNCWESSASVAVLLAETGIYGVMSYFVSERTREFGIRVALGAQSADVLGMVAKTGLRLALMGVGAGTLLALGVTRVILALLYDVKPWDPVTYAAVGVALTAVALLACFVPARRDESRSDHRPAL